MTTTAAESMADVVKTLCDRIAAADANLQAERIEHGYTKATLGRARSDNAQADRLAEHFRRQLAEANQKLKTAAEAEPRRIANLAKLDRITLDLYHLIVELEGHRDTGKTKAERVALGHVAERLKAIRGWDEGNPS